MRKIRFFIAILLLVCLCLSNIHLATAEEVSSSVVDSLNLANKFMNDYWQLDGYFLDINKKNKGIIEKWAVKRNGKNPDAFFNYPVLVYGDEQTGAEEATKFGHDKRVYDNQEPKQPRAIGFSFLDNPYANPKFQIDNVDYVRRWIYEPWDLPDKDTKDGGITKKLTSDDPRDTYIRQWLEFQPGVESSQYSVMKQWIKESKFTPNKIARQITNKDRPNRELNRKFFNNNIYDPLPNAIKSNPEDYIYIIQPPTYESWGIGIAFYYYGGNGKDSVNKPNYYSYYEYFRYMPFKMIKKDILSAEFEYVSPYSPLNEIEPGQEVALGIKINSKNEDALKDVSYNLQIKNDKGEILNKDKIKLNSAGNIDLNKSTINIPKDGEFFYIYFTMPDSAVNIRFSVNENNKNPEESSIDNNIISTRFKPMKLEKYDLDYNILSRKVKYPLADYDITATLSLENGNWKGNATGSLDVPNNTDILNGYKNYNQPVNEDSVKIVKNPIIKATLLRTDFGDNPLERGWLKSPTPPTTIVKYGVLNFSGEVKRNYEYTEKCTEEENCQGHIKSGTKEADFDKGKNTCKVSTYIYNGKPTIDPISYRKEIVSNIGTSKNKTMYWTSEPYSFDVIRLMYNMDEDNKLSDPIQVPGQYDRIFTNQDKATTSWEIASSMKDEYKTSREAARRRDTRKSLLKSAVFASDKKFSTIPYPIRSGYYFNPTGTYTFTITTETYKTTQDSTKDHEDIVEAFINAFRYESNLVYKNKSGQAVDLQNRSVGQRGGKGYGGRTATISFKDPIGLDNQVWLEKVYDKKDPKCYIKNTPEPIEFPATIDERKDGHLSVDTTSDNVNGMDERWKKILEGYSASKTLSSFGNFKYREYVNNSYKQTKNKAMYKITETSTVTIKVNPKDTKAYTHKAMADGDYTVRAYIDDIVLNTHEGAYNVLGTLQGISTLDSINIEVVGSIDDDKQTN